MIKYGDCFVKPSMYYWQHQSRNGNAEVDYLSGRDGRVLPIEVKANTQGSMQSLYLFMRKRHLTDAEDNQSVRHIEIVPLYALSTLMKVKASSALPLQNTI